ncbi:hypothetical protein BGZ52_001275 [Haplosporangium bisporale]|nr:hypothetical protein BGZ52_001275 [Haplosporangium bisporale]KAF9212629.1 hypothetical protein BGZ59_006503 [Podila verticillata]KAI9235553.1 MAG: hypothetical protein BYD32DRAFT_463348 [Podila humilis]KFH64179.1 hypothetical protein MVEG_10004 [Podila verticillata NRRL 6337]
MVNLALPLLDNTDNENPNSTLPVCDPSMSIYDAKSCLKDSLFCSDDNPCPLGISCIDRVCQCLPNTHSYITLTPDPVRMYTIGCNFDKQRESGSCRDYEYGVQKTCVLNYCSSEVPCYAGSCDNQRHVCVNITSARTTLPVSSNPVISLGNDPFGTKKEGLSPLIIIMAAAGGVVALALVGCIIRTVHQGTRGIVGLVSGKSKKGSDDGESTEYTDKDGQYNNNISPLSEQQPAPAGAALTRGPSKFTGAHYMPSPAIRPVNDSSSLATSGESPNFSPFTNHVDSPKLNPFRSRADTDASSNGSIELSGRGLGGLGDDLGTPKRLSRSSYISVRGGVPIISSEITIAGHAQPQSAIYEGFGGESASLQHAHRPDSTVLSSAGPMSSSESLASESRPSPPNANHLDPSALSTVHRSPSQSTLRQTPQP